MIIIVPLDKDQLKCMVRYWSGYISFFFSSFYLLLSCVQTITYSAQALFLFCAERSLLEVLGVVDRGSHMQCSWSNKAWPCAKQTLIIPYYPLPKIYIYNILISISLLNKIFLLVLYSVVMPGGFPLKYESINTCICMFVDSLKQSQK